MARRILLLFPQLNNMVFFGVYELRGKCGKTSFRAFLKGWVFVRVLVLRLRWRRREIYRAANARVRRSSAPRPMTRNESPASRHSVPAIRNASR